MTESRWWVEVTIGDGGEVAANAWPMDALEDDEKEAFRTAHVWSGDVIAVTAAEAAIVGLLRAERHFWGSGR